MPRLLIPPDRAGPKITTSCRRRTACPVRSLTAENAYLVIHAPRQSGKTTCSRILAASPNTEGEDAAVDRVSVPYFFQPSFGAVIETIPTTVDDEHPLHYDPVVAGEWITAKSMAMLED